MKCPYCGHNEDKVVDSRATQDNSSIRRRRECLNCGRRFTTYEYIEKIPLMVIKKDGRREAYSRSKITQGIIHACQKRPISIDRIEALIDEIEKEIQKKFDREIESRFIGQMVMEKLAKLDDVAYVRFASVYRSFRDVNQFMKELRDVINKKLTKK
ncbi:MAG: transcriptional repressor NrdR [Candidatus Omnitrophica bacterium]|nr:transcriptional repressor NrdR [Candidatus Omnitrophota bacterium]